MGEPGVQRAAARYAENVRPALARLAELVARAGA
jgi:hypothetical protein